MVVSMMRVGKCKRAGQGEYRSQCQGREFHGRFLSRGHQIITGANTGSRAPFRTRRMGGADESADARSITRTAVSVHPCSSTHAARLRSGLVGTGVIAADQPTSVVGTTGLPSVVTPMHPGEAHAKRTVVGPT